MDDIAKVAASVFSLFPLGVAVKTAVFVEDPPLYRSINPRTFALCRRVHVFRERLKRYKSSLSIFVQLLPCFFMPSLRKLSSAFVNGTILPLPFCLFFCVISVTTTVGWFGTILCDFSGDFLTFDNMLCAFSINCAESSFTLTFSSVN